MSPRVPRPGSPTSPRSRRCSPERTTSRAPGVLRGTTRCPSSPATRRARSCGAYRRPGAVRWSYEVIDGDGGPDQERCASRPSHRGCCQRPHDRWETRRDPSSSPTVGRARRPPPRRAAPRDAQLERRKVGNPICRDFACDEPVLTGFAALLSFTGCPTAAPASLATNEHGEPRA